MYDTDLMIVFDKSFQFIPQSNMATIVNLIQFDINFYQES